MIDVDFAEHLALAISEAVPERQQRICSLRFGLTDGQSYKLAEIGQEFGVSRERVRQLLDKSMRRIRSTARQQRRAGRYDADCARLLAYLEGSVRPSEPGCVERCVSMVCEGHAYLPSEPALKLAAYLLGFDEEVEQLLSRAVREYKARLRLEAREGRIQAKFGDFVVYSTWWPREPRSVESLPVPSRKRHVNPDSCGVVGAFHSTKLNREVQYESALKLAFYSQLERSPHVRWYQEQPLAVPYSFDESMHLYFPDVMLGLDDGRVIVAELKPVFHMVQHVNLVKFAALRQYCILHGLGLLITDGRTSIENLRQHLPPVPFEGEVLAATTASTLSWCEYRAIRERHAASFRDFSATVLRNGLVWTLHPFSLRQPTATRDDHLVAPDTRNSRG